MEKNPLSPPPQVQNYLILVDNALSSSIPNLLRSRLDANEASALYSLQTIRNCASSYRVVNSTYPEDLTALGSGKTPYIDPVLASGEKQGYIFSFTGEEYTFSSTASPKLFNLSGQRSFFVDESGVLRYTNVNTAATVDDPPVN